MAAPALSSSGLANVPTTSITIHDNPDGWGPSPTYAPEKYRDVPYFPFSKGDKLGRIADWTGQSQFQQRGQRHNQPQPVNTAFNYYHVNDDESFTTVDGKPTRTKNYYTRGRFNPRGRGYAGRGGQQGRGGGQGGWQQRGGAGGGQSGQMTMQNRKKYDRGGRGGRGQGGWSQMNRRAQETLAARLPSVEVRPDWQHVQDLEMPTLQRLIIAEPEAEDILDLGDVEFYDPEFDRITAKSERPLEKTDRVNTRIPPTDDPVLQQQAQEGASNIFTSSAILALLMAAPRSVFSWDVEVTKRGNQLWLTRKEYSAIDNVTVDETAYDPQAEQAQLDPINLPEALTREATLINANFSQQVLNKVDGARFQVGEPLPSSANAKAVHKGLRYRRWQLTEEFNIVARCEVDGAARPRSEFDKSGPETLHIRALNEWDAKLSGGADYRQRLDSQKGAVLANELKNNSAKLARWTLDALLADVGSIKIGYVSRHQPKDPNNHVILGVQGFRPRELATLTGVNPNNGWAVLHRILSILTKQPDGQYVILKQPAKQTLSFYALPAAPASSEVKKDA